MIKADEHAREQLRSGWSLIAYGLLYAAGVTVMFGLIQRPSSEPGLWPLILSGPLGIILGGVITLVSAPRWQRFEQRRQAAASAMRDTSYLAAVQPAPDEEALSLPCTIEIKPNLLRIILFFGCMLLAINGCIFALPNASYAIFISLIVTGSVLLIIIILSLILLRQRIEITEQDMRIKSTIMVQRIRWQDARFFAVLSANLLSKRNHLTGGYELSGPGAIVRWMRLTPGRHFSLFRFMLKPALPSDEYDRQMDALLSVIAAKTGLPLYDLR
jgi:hypothetical protein